MAMCKYVIETMTDKEVMALGADLKEDINPYICETAGFVPLEVKFKRFELAGKIAQFNASEFTSQDLRDMYLSPDFDIYPDDNLDDIEEKMQALQKHIQEIKTKVAKRSASASGGLATRQAVSAAAAEKGEEKE